MTYVEAVEAAKTGATVRHPLLATGWAMAWRDGRACFLDARGEITRFGATAGDRTCKDWSVVQPVLVPIAVPVAKRGRKPK